MPTTQTCPRSFASTGPGINDFGPPEIFTTDDAATVERWAAGQHLAELSF